ncbi:hypothetical protein AX17_006392 [Amanita inopinata Kibby_2008]|nr:hypothetical protein AX17_006392 [Amanita inopinata Kibby_2008]
MLWDDKNRIELAKILSLTFYKDAETTARRASPLLQLVCRGKPCKLYQPDVVHCRRLPGGSGTDVDWKCEADLPDSLRFGRVEVNCEGWSKPGDPHVLKGSCSLEYRLVEVPGALRGNSVPGTGWRTQDILSGLFTVLWSLVLFYILYHFFYNLFSRNRSQSASRPSSGPRPSGGGGGGGTYGGSSHPFPGAFDEPPPPYSATYKQNSSGEGWRPGFWTGAALGGLTTHLFSNRREPRPIAVETPRAAAYDWERERSYRIPFVSRPIRRATPARSVYDEDDRGEGPSNLGSMRRSTGYGGTNVR